MAGEAVANAQPVALSAITSPATANILNELLSLSARLRYFCVALHDITYTGHWERKLAAWWVSTFRHKSDVRGSTCNTRT